MVARSYELTQKRNGTDTVFSSTKCTMSIFLKNYSNSYQITVWILYPSNGPNYQIIVTKIIKQSYGKA